MIEQAATVFAGSVRPVSRKESGAKPAELFEPRTGDQLLTRFCKLGTQIGKLIIFTKQT